MNPVKKITGDTDRRKRAEERSRRQDTTMPAEQQKKPKRTNTTSSNVASGIPVATTATAITSKQQQHQPSGATMAVQHLMGYQESTKSPMRPRPTAEHSPPIVPDGVDEELPSHSEGRSAPLENISPGTPLERTVVLQHQVQPQVEDTPVTSTSATVKNMTPSAETLVMDNNDEVGALKGDKNSGNYKDDILFQLIQNGISVGNVKSVSVPKNSTIDTIKEAVKQLFKDDELDGIGHIFLLVYALRGKDEEDLRLEPTITWDATKHGGDAVDRPLIIKAPARPITQLTAVPDEVGKRSPVPNESGKSSVHFLNSLQRFMIQLQLILSPNEKLYTSLRSSICGTYGLVVMVSPQQEFTYWMCLLQSKSNNLHLSTIERAAQNLGQQFLDSFTTNYNIAALDGGMQVMKNIISLERGEAVNVIVRQIAEPFWKVCIDTCEANYRVCAIGTPGIGKTSSIVIPIRLLLLNGRTVVYQKRTKSAVGWIYEFIPPTGNGASYVCNVYRESAGISHVPSITHRDTYYVVDPGDTTDSCNLSTVYPYAYTKVIIVSSPNEMHWGGRQFQKKQHHIEPRFKHYPMWTEQELITACPYMEVTLSTEKIKRRFALFGGVPGLIFIKDENIINDRLEDQERGANSVTEDQARLLFMNGLDAVETTYEKMSKSALIGVGATDDPTFSERKAVPISKRTEFLLTLRSLGTIAVRKNGHLQGKSLKHTSIFCFGPVEQCASQQEHHRQDSHCLVCSHH